MLQEQWTERETVPGKGLFNRLAIGAHRPRSTSKGQMITQGNTRPLMRLHSNRATLSGWSRKLALMLAVFLGVQSGLSSPLVAQGLPLIRDREIERLLSDYASPIFEAAGLGGGRITIRIVRSNVFNAFVVDGKNVYVPHRRIDAIPDAEPDHWRNRP